MAPGTSQGTRLRAEAAAGSQRKGKHSPGRAGEPRTLLARPPSLTTLSRFCSVAKQTAPLGLCQAWKISSARSSAGKVESHRQRLLPARTELPQARDEARPALPLARYDRAGTGDALPGLMQEGEFGEGEGNRFSGDKFLFWGCVAMVS